MNHPPPSYSSLYLFLPLPPSSLTRRHSLQDVGTEIRRFLPLSSRFFSRASLQSTLSHDRVTLFNSNWRKKRKKGKKEKDDRRRIERSFSPPFRDFVRRFIERREWRVSCVYTHDKARFRINKVSGWLTTTLERRLDQNFGLRDEFARMLKVAYRACIGRTSWQIIRKAPRAGRPDVHSPEVYCV